MLILGLPFGALEVTPETVKQCLKRDLGAKDPIVNSLTVQKATIIAAIPVSL